MEFEKIAIAIGLLTPLILGILAFIEKFMNRKKPADNPKDEKGQPQEIVQGMTVKPTDFAAELVAELRRDVAEAEERARKAQMELEAYKEANRSNRR